jgi:hypothetical protein
MRVQGGIAQLLVTILKSRYECQCQTLGNYNTMRTAGESDTRKFGQTKIIVTVINRDRDGGVSGTCPWSVAHAGAGLARLGPQHYSLRLMPD